MSVLLTVGIWVAGVESNDLRHFRDLVEAPVGGRLVEAIGWIVPAFSAFDIKLDIVHGHAVSLGLVLYRLLYAAVYSAVAVGAAVLAFARREFL